MDSIDFVTEERCLKSCLRIALVTETYPPEVNGVAMTLSRLVDGMIARGHHIQLVRPRQYHFEQGLSREEFSEVLSTGVPIPRYQGLRFGLPLKTRLVRLWSKQRPDLVHVATEGPLGWSAVSAARKLSIPLSSSFHTNFDHYSQHYGVGWLEQSVAAWLKRLHNRTLMTLVPTQEMAQLLRQRGYRNVDVIARGVDTQLYHPEKRDEALRRSWGVAATDLVVLSVGRVAPEKNLALVIDAFQAIQRVSPNAQLVIVGDGPLRDKLQQQYPYYHFVGMKVGEELAQHYASADLFLFPSLSETFGNVTLEAMASGLCVVAFDYAAAAECLIHDISGILVKVEDSVAFCEAAWRVAADATKRAMLGQAARQKSETIDWMQISDALIARFAALIEADYRKNATFIQSAQRGDD